MKIPEGLPRFFDLGGRGLYVPLEQIIAHFLPALFPGVTIVERAVFRVTRDADFEVSDDADDLLEAVETQLRRRRFGDVVRVEVSSSASSEMVARLPERPRRRRDADLPRREPARPLRAARARRPRPAGAEARAVDPRHPAAPRERAERRSRDLRRDPARRRPRAPAVRLVPRELRGVRAGSRSRPERHRDEDRGVPHERRQRARRLAHPVRRGGEAVRLPRGAEGALRRAAQHRVVARAGAGGRPRRVRVPGPQDPREDDAHRPPRGRRASAATRTSARATTTRRPRARTRTSGSSPRTRRSRPTSPTSSTTSPASAGRRSSASSSSRRSRCAAGSSTRSARGRRGRGRRKHARIRLKLNHLVDPKIVDELYAASQAGATDRHHRPLDLRAPARVSRASRRTSTSARSSDASSSTAVSTPSRPTSASPTYIGSPDLMQRNLDHRIEVLDARRERSRPGRRFTRSSTAPSRTTPTRGSSCRRETGSARCPRSRTSRTPITRR